MARIKKESPMKLAIVSAATELFFENGFSGTTAAAICKRADVGTGNLTSYFPTKEHILDVLVEMMCEFQWHMMEEATDEGKSSMLAYCLELTTMAAVSEKKAHMKDFFLSAYAHPMTLHTMRKNDVEKLKRVFGSYCEDWSEERFSVAEDIISGIEYGTLMDTEASAPLPARIAGALDTILCIFGVPEQLRRTKIAKVLDMDYYALGERLLCAFIDFVREENDRAIDELLASYKLK